MQRTGSQITTRVAPLPGDRIFAHLPQGDQSDHGEFVTIVMENMQDATGSHVDC